MMSNILVLDDNLEVGRQIQAMLQENPTYQIEALNDPQYLIPALDYQMADLILMDFNMPGNSGIEMLELLKAHQKYQHIPVIMITGEDNEHLLKLCFEKGAVDFIRKPISIIELQGRIDSSLKVHEYERNLEKLVEEKTQQLIHSAKLSLLGELTASIAHELRQPLSLIMVIPDLILDDFKEGNHADFEKSVESLKVAVQRVFSITERMRTFSRKEEKELRTSVSLNKLLDNTMILLDMKLSKHQITVERNIPEDFPNLYCNPTEIEQIFTNLFSNASAAFDSESIEKKITVSANQQQNSVFINIEDTAGGIPEDILSQIFDSFFTTKDVINGTGLGLSISKSIAENHGGKLIAENNELGAKFILELPRAP